ncbi:hypothetical protein LVJ94_42350 [Pendulispora rubella]|uniref:SMI1/KNR4 family protein n=1 Tax=Pendulispora rubella TaxID=2741070 RepID=A0ABZ2KXV9_9BACT
MPLARLCELVSRPLVQGPPFPLHGHFGHSIGDALHSLLRLKNGFFGFDNALHVFPDINVGTLPGIIRWNDLATWRYAYGGLADRGVFFADTVFGDSFVWRGQSICRFDAQTATYLPIAHSMEEWASLLLHGPTLWTGQKLAAAWQSQNGPLPRGQRLVPKEPFAPGCAYKVENLRAMDAVASMRLRGEFALQWRRDVTSGVRKWAG